MTTRMSPRCYAVMVAVELEEKAEALEARSELGKEDTLRLEAYRTAIKHIEEDPDDWQTYERATNGNRLGLLAERAKTQNQYDTVACCLSLLHYTDHNHGVEDIAETALAMRRNGWVVATGSITFEHVVACKKLRDYELYGHPECLFSPIAGEGPDPAQMDRLVEEARGHQCLPDQVYKELMDLLMDLPTAVDDVLALAAKGAFKTTADIMDFSRCLNGGKYMSMPHRDGTRRSLWPKQGKDVR